MITSYYVHVMIKLHIFFEILLLKKKENLGRFFVDYVKK